MKFCPKSTDLHSSQKERQLQKSCVSFGEECTSNKIIQQAAAAASTKSGQSTLTLIAEILGWNLCCTMSVGEFH